MANTSRQKIFYIFAGIIIILTVMSVFITPNSGFIPSVHAKGIVNTERNSSDSGSSDDQKQSEEAKKRDEQESQKRLEQEAREAQIRKEQQAKEEQARKEQQDRDEQIKREQQQHDEQAQRDEKARIERERKEQELRDQETKSRQEKALQAEQDRIRREQEERERQAQENNRRKEQDRIRQEQAETDRLIKEREHQKEQDRIRQEQADTDRLIKEKEQQKNQDIIRQEQEERDRLIKERERQAEQEIRDKQNKDIKSIHTKKDRTITDNNNPEGSTKPDTRITKPDDRTGRTNRPGTDIDERRPSTDKKPTERSEGTSDVRGQIEKRGERRDSYSDFKKHYEDPFYYPYDPYFYDTYPFDRNEEIIIVKPEFIEREPVYIYPNPSSSYENPAPGSFEEILDDIGLTWIEYNPNLLMKHIADGSTVDVYINGEFSHSMAASQLYKLTAESLNQIETIEFKYTDIIESSTAVKAKASHKFIGPDGENDERTVYLTYYLERVGQNWSIARIDIQEVGSNSSAKITASASPVKNMDDAVILKKFKDKYLLTNIPGKVFMEFYDRISAPVNSCMEKNELSRGAMRVLMKPIVQLCRLAVRDTDTDN